MDTFDVIIVGAGACGMLCARELAKKGKKILVLEARDRIGGRIYPYEPRVFGQSSERGAEFVHGNAPITKKLLSEAGLTFVPETGSAWSTRSGTLVNLSGYHDLFDEFTSKASLLTEDMTVSDFIDTHLPHIKNSKHYIVLSEYIEGYHAGSMEDMSTQSLLRELGKPEEATDGWIREGYGALMTFLYDDCIRQGVSFSFQSEVQSIDIHDDVAVVRVQAQEYRAKCVIVTTPLPLLKLISGDGISTRQREAAGQIGFGSVTKTLFLFRSRWWEKCFGAQVHDMSFLLADDTFITWWVQKDTPAMVGWLGGPKTSQFDGMTTDEMRAVCIASCARVFGVSETFVCEELVKVEITHWRNEQYTKGGYSFSTIGADSARASVRADTGVVMLAGEAFAAQGSIATVEGAFESALHVVSNITGYLPK